MRSGRMRRHASVQAPKLVEHLFLAFNLLLQGSTGGLSGLESILKIGVDLLELQSLRRVRLFQLRNLVLHCLVRPHQVARLVPVSRRVLEELFQKKLGASLGDFDLSNQTVAEVLEW